MSQQREEIRKKQERTDKNKDGGDLRNKNNERRQQVIKLIN